ncbi:MAG: hypothetical protein AAGG44_12125 [Planctomycetota bacterium]
MAGHTAIRELLIQSCHSSDVADEKLTSQLGDAAFIADLVEIARDRDGFGGDAPMQAAYYLSQAAPELLVPHAKTLLEAVTVADDGGYMGHLSIAIAKTNATSAKSFIESAASDPSRIDAWLFREAMTHFKP